MLSPVALYPAVDGFLQALGWIPHLSARLAVSQLVSTLLVSQSLRPADLMRASLSPPTVPARQRYERLTRAWLRPWLSPSLLTPVLVRAALVLTRIAPPPRGPEGAWVVVLDSVRCGPWEIFTLSLVWHGRALPLSWAILPYPWPKKQFTPTVCALIRHLAAAWPPDQPVHLVADRGFPSRELFATLRQVTWHWTVRLRATSYVTVNGVSCWAKDLLNGAARERWQAWPACYGKGASACPGTLVIGQGLAVVPWHQRTPGSLRHRAARQAARLRHLATKHPGRRPDASAQTDAWVILFTSQTHALATARTYRLRWTTEGTYRDGQGGWDGRHGWGIEETLSRQTKSVVVERMVGLWALATLLQTWIGAQTLCPTASPLLKAHLRQWATSPRLSLWARGHFAFTDPRGFLDEWLLQTLRDGATDLRASGLLSPTTNHHLQQEVA